MRANQITYKSMFIDYRIVVMLLLLTFGLPTEASGQTRPVQSYDRYKSWLVACDNVLACEAKGFGDGELRAEAKIARAMGPSGSLRVTIAAEGNFDLGDVAVDGKTISLRETDWTISSDDDGTQFTTMKLAAAQALVEAISGGQFLELGRTAKVPLDGFSAALLRIDERQHRVGGVTALLRPGPRPAARVPQAANVPLISARPISARLAPGEDKRLIARARRDSAEVFEAEDCSDREGLIPVDVYALDSARALVLVPCLLGAYQGSSLAFVVPRTSPGRTVRLVLTAPYGGNTGFVRPIDLFTEAGFDPATGMFFTAAKGRGLADCGFSVSWVWTGGQMILSDMSLQQSCGGMAPGDWPTLYRSRQK